MSWLKSLFVSEKTIGKTVDAAISAGDKLFYTSEEKADDKAELRKWYIDLLASMKPFNVAMRLLALGVFAMWSIHLIASTGLYVAAFFACSQDGYCAAAELGRLLEVQMGSHINGHFSTIIMFYFGAAGVNSIVSTAKGSKS